MSLIDGLRPEVKAKCEALLEKAALRGIILRVTQAFRSSQEQAALYAKGRTVPGPGYTAQRPMGSIVTKAPPGFSWHEYRRAFDVAVMVDGHPTWPNDRGLWEEIGEMGEACGLEWGGRFKTILDLPHFQDRAGMTLAEAKEEMKRAG